MTTVSTATLIAFAATLSTDTEARPVAVREWCQRQSSPIEVLDAGFEIFQGAGLFVLDGRLHYAEGIGYPDGAGCYGESVALTDLFIARDLAVRTLPEPTTEEITSYAALHGLIDLGLAASCLRSLADQDAIDAVDCDFGV